jgi:ribulose kinase
MKDIYTLGLDFGTNSVRALIVNVQTGWGRDRHCGC